MAEKYNGRIYEIQSLEREWKCLYDNFFAAGGFCFLEKMKTT